MWASHALLDTSFWATTTFLFRKNQWFVLGRAQPLSQWQEWGGWRWGCSSKKTEVKFIAPTAQFWWLHTYRKGSLFFLIATYLKVFAQCPEERGVSPLSHWWVFVWFCNGDCLCSGVWLWITCSIASDLISSTAQWDDGNKDSSKDQIISFM